MNQAVIAFGGNFKDEFFGGELVRIWAHYIDIDEFEWGSPARANYKI